MHIDLNQLNKRSTKEIFELNKSRTRESSFHEVIVILDNIRSMHNVGSFFRTMDAFGLRKLFLCGITPYPPRPEISKSALGADEYVNWEYRKDIISLLHELKSESYSIIGIEQTKTSVQLHQYSLESDNKLAIVFGNEVSGIDEEVLSLCDTNIEIPQFGHKHSFNVSVSFGIVSYALFEKFQHS